MRKFSALVVVLFFAGCSNQAVYDNIQLNNRRECNRVPPSQYEECIERARKSYEAYERARKEAIGK
jgi:hypothetical protein